MTTKQRTYLCIDLKSFYASVECVERNLDPLTTRLVVADPERTEKTICLAITPAMKTLGIHNRCRVFDIPRGVDYITAPPRMKLYLEYAAEIYGVYLRYIAKEDIYVYSIDEAFMEVTDYLELYRMSAQELAKEIMSAVKKETGITATAGIGTNLYLTKVALDITAKHAADHIGYLDEALFCQTLWQHRPLTDFWRIGPRTAKKLASLGIQTMEDIAHTDEDFLYSIFGVDAELMIDHAWGREPVTLADVKRYTPRNSSLCSGQVLARDYSFEDCRLIVKEMVDALCLELTDKELVTDSLSLAVGYSSRLELKAAVGTATLDTFSNSYRHIVPAVLACYDRIMNRQLPIRRLSISCNRLRSETYEQYDLFTDPEESERDRRLQKAALEIRKRFGNNALVRGMDLLKAGTALERNRQIGGHRME